jgi:hypothetical protein
MWMECLSHQWITRRFPERDAHHCFCMDLNEKMDVGCLKPSQEAQDYELWLVRVSADCEWLGTVVFHYYTVSFFMLMDLGFRET